MKEVQDMPPLVSVIVPTYNRRWVLEKCLRSLLAQTCSPQLYEIIVIDDGSTDGTRDMVAQLVGEWGDARPVATQPEAEAGPSADSGARAHAVACPLVYRYQDHACAAAARNAGIKLSRGTLVIFLDSDIVTKPDFIAAHMREHLKGAASPAADVPRAGSDAAAALCDSRVIVHGRVIYTTNLDSPTREPRKVSDISTAFFATTNVSIARRWLIEAGLFDEDFTEYGWEDLELGKRLKKLGLRVVRSEAPAGYHLKREFRTEDLPAIKRREIERGRMAIVYVKKHPTFSVRMTTLTVAPFIWLVSILGAGGWPDRPVAVRVLERLRRRGHRALLGVVLQIMVYYWYVQGIKEASARQGGSGVGL
ncbi:MAG: glycosyltransferase family 2 protein [Betaproteobacteria bacterium]